MTKAEFYNKAIDLYKQTGQGLPFFIKYKLPNPYIVDELVSDGLMKIVTQSYNTLPDGKWICLTNVYCVEDESINSRVLAYMRMYIGIDPLIDLTKITFTIKQAIKDSEFMKNYSEWLSKNDDVLKKINSIEYMIEEGNVLDTSTLEFLKSRNFFKDNKTVKICKSELIDGTNKTHERIDLTQKIINLKEKQIQLGQTQYVDEILNDKKDLEKEKESLKLRAKIKVFLDKQDENSLIQDLI